MVEKAVLLGPRRAIVGVLTEPENKQPENNTAVLIFNAGLIHHAGPGRIHVKLARQLAKLGISSVRFDFSGVGDSSVRTDNLPVLEVATREPREVMDDLQRRGFQHFILAGICSGAYSVFQTAIKDDRVMGGVLINPQGIVSDDKIASKVWSRRYWSNSIFRPKAWLNLITGKVNYGRLLYTLKERLIGSIQAKKNDNADTEQFVRKEVQKLIERGTSILFILSGKDVSREYLGVLLGDKILSMQATGLISVKVIEDADHLFKHGDHQKKFIQEFCDWSVSVQPCGQP